MAKSKTDFPPVRACLFDMDGLLIDSEDMYTICTNAILHEYGKPSLPWPIKAQLQGRPGPEAGRIFHAWAQLPITHDVFMTKQSALQRLHFPRTKPLPGVPHLLSTLVSPKTKPKVHIALATSSGATNYHLKTKHLSALFGLFPENQVVLGDDTRLKAGRGKPAPDIYLLALETVNESIRKDGGREITPEECLVFEDSVPGIEAGRRAGMRVVWCPHPGLLNEYKGREKEVLAGRTGEHKENEVVDCPDGIDGETMLRVSGRPGEIDDGWGELLETLEEFEYEKYDIQVS